MVFGETSPVRLRARFRQRYGPAMSASALGLAPAGVRAVLIAQALFTAVGAAGGAVMLITKGLGDLAVTDTRLGALGFTSWAPGGVMLALGVSLPMAVAGAMVWADHPWGLMVALLAGLVRHAGDPGYSEARITTAVPGPGIGRVAAMAWRRRRTSAEAGPQLALRMSTTKTRVEPPGMDPFAVSP